MASSSILASLSLEELSELKKQVVRVLESCDRHRLQLHRFKQVYKDKFKKKFEKHYGKLKSKRLKDVMAALHDVVSLEESGSDIIMKLKDGSRHRSANKDLSSQGDVDSTAAAAESQDSNQNSKLPANTSVLPTTDKTLPTGSSARTSSPDVFSTIATPAVLKDGETSQGNNSLTASGGEVSDRVILKACRRARKSSTKEKERDVTSVTLTHQVNTCIKENAGSVEFSQNISEKPGAIEDGPSEGNMATVLSHQGPLSPVSAAFKMANLPLSPPLQRIGMGYEMQESPLYVTGACGTIQSSPSLREIMAQQEREERFTNKDLLNSPAVGYGRLLNEMGTPNTMKRTPVYSSPPLIDARVREVGQPGPFEKSIEHAQHIMSTGKAKTRRTCSLQEVNKVAEGIISSLSEEGQFVSLEVVKAKICKEFGKLSFHEFNFKRDNAIPALHDLIQLQAKVNLFVHAYVMINSIATLYELNQSLADLASKPDFEDLKLGPLLQQPVVYDMFKAPPDFPVPRITTIQILKHLERYMTKEDLWRKKVDLKSFLEYLCEQHDCDTPYKLGVRIQSVGLAISVIKQAKKSDSERWKAVREQVSDDMDEEIQRQMRKIKKDLLGQDLGDLRSCVMKFLDTSPVDALNEIFNCSMDLFEGKRQEKITKFLTAITNDSLGRRLFQLTLYMSCKRLLRDTLEHLVADEVQKQVANIVDKSQDTETRPIPPSEGRVVEEVKEWLANADHMDLVRLALIEENVVSKFPEFNSFEELGYGSFLKLLASHKELVEAIEQVGGLARSGGMGTVLGGQVSPNSVLEFISQCGTQTSHEIIERNLCSYYGIMKVTDLGFGSFSNLLKKAEDRPRINTPSVVYEAALLCHEPGAKGSSASEEHNGGVLGYMSKEDALAAIRSTPLLEDVALWTHWDEVFGGDVSKLGDLKSFLENEGILMNAGKSSSGIHGSLIVMETSAGVLLRVTANTSTEIFKECACRGDAVGAAGHLVSMVMVNGGVANTPVALLSNHVQSFLAAMASHDKDGCDHRSEFVLQCLVRMPRRLAETVGTKVFLEPLKKLVGSMEAPSLLLSSCLTQFQRSRLHQLGFALGISQWIEDFRSRVSYGKGEDFGWKLAALEDEERKRPIAVVRPVPSSNEQINQLSEDSVTVLENETTISLSETSSNVGGEEDAVTSDADNNLRTQSTSHASSTEQEEECRAVIEQIRRDDFGIGLELGEEESKVVQRQREREGRGLHRLSTELYSRDTHFVLELVQNADDNSYPEDSCDRGFPSLLFLLERDKIVVLNNEVGFMEKNIRALCDVGRSTKGAHRYGYIGQKGIGFKSVFRVSDCPEVHSNGYHIRFDAKSGPIGYILPQWIEEGGREEQRCEDQVEDTSEENLDEEGVPVRREDDGWSTRIVLPLKEEHQGIEKTSLAARFRDVHPSLLLFLHRLRAIRIQDKVNNTNRDMIRKDLGDNIMEVSHTHGTDRWLVIKKQLDASHVKEDVEVTELALAFPLFNDSDQETSLGRRHQTLPQQNVFAYLPLRSYGFRFIIQGDFEVPSSREDVDGDKSWNQWLREEIPQLFIDALSVFMEHSFFSDLSSVASYFQFVPLEEEILDFFTPVARHILTLLQGKPCIPVKMPSPETEQPNSFDSYDWVLPCKTIFCQDSTTQQLITPALLEEHLGLQYLHPDIASALNPTLRSRLGIETLSSKHLIEIGKAEVKKISVESSVTVSDGDDRRPDVTRIAWLAQWLQCMYRCLEKERNSNQDMLDLIRSLNVIPLTNGTFVDLKGDSVFLPLSIKKVSEGAVPKKKKLSNVKPQEQTCFSVLERDLSTVHPALFSSLDDIGRTQVEQLLRRLGVKNWSARDLINSHIIPTFNSDKWKAKSIEVLRSYLVYILEQRLSDPSVCDINELRSCVQILTNKGALNAAQTPIYFTPKFGNNIDLARALPSISWTLVDESYLDSCSGSKARTTDWKNFLTELGLKHFLAIKKKQVKLHRNSMAQTSWASYEPIWQTTPDGLYIIDDCACEEFEEFLSKILSPDAKRPFGYEESKVLAQCIDERWESEYSQYADGLVPVKDSNGHKLTETRSSFYLNLVSKPWMSASDGVTSCFSRDLFMRSESVYRLLENHVKYTAADLKNNAFISALRIRESISVDGMISEMRKWSAASGKSEEGSQSREFSTSVAHMSEVYSFLYQKMVQCEEERRKINDAFRKNALIFVPKQPQTMHQSPGMFCSKKDVCWHDPTDVASELLKDHGKVTTRRLLQGLYHISPKASAHQSLAAFFVDELNVDETPNVDEYLEMATTVAEVARFPTPSSLSYMLKIFVILGKKCLARGQNNNIRNENEIDVNMVSFIKQSLETEQKCIFPSSGKWVSLSDKPLQADDKSLVKIFQKEKGVHFLDLGDVFQLQKQRSTSGQRMPEQQREEMKHVSLFLKSCEVKLLSECISKNFTPRGTVLYQCVPVQKYFHQMIPYVQQFLYSRNQTVYRELNSKRFAQKLLHMQFASVKSLETVYSLSTHQDVHISIEEKSGVQTVGSSFCLYVVQEYQENADVLNVEMAKLVLGGKKQGSSDLSNFLGAVKNYSGSDFKFFLEEIQNLEPLPDGEELWCVPPPEEPEIVEVEEEASTEETPSLNIDTLKQSKVGDDGLHSWPPKSAAQYEKTRKHETEPSNENTLKMWPPPAPPDSVKKSLEEQIQGRQTQRDIGTGKPNEVGHVTREPVEKDEVIPQQRNPALVMGAVTEEMADQTDLQNDLNPTVEDEVIETRVLEDCLPNGKEASMQDMAQVGPRSLPKPVPGDVFTQADPGYEARQISSADAHLWLNVETSELDYEDLPFNGDMKILDAIPLVENPNKEEIGRWGEQCVYEFLLNQAKSVSSDIEVEIVWKNEKGNTTAPYDFEIRRRPDVHSSIVTTYVEVKTTSSDQKDVFEISVPELRFALAKKEALHLYRVFNAGKPSCLRIHRLKNLAAQLERKNVKLCMMI